MSEAPQAEFSFPVEMTAISRTAKAYSLAPDEAARGRIAARLKIPAVNALSGAMTLRRQGREIFVAGRVTADLVRECVASLEEMPEQIEEEFELAFRQGDGTEAAGGEDDDLDAPEPVEGDTLDLGEILVQQLSLAMAPFPRKQGARSLAEDYDGGGTISPFDVLRGAGEKHKPNQ